MFSTLYFLKNITYSNKEKTKLNKNQKVGNMTPHNPPAMSSWICLHKLGIAIICQPDMIAA